MSDTHKTYVEFPGRSLFIGFGSIGHVSALLESWRDVRVEPDLAGIPRVIAARRPA